VSVPGSLGQPDGKHAAEPAGHLPGRDLVTWMTGQPRVEHGRQRGMPVQPGGDRHSGLGGAAHPQEQRAHATLQ